jgi:organic radical activating enzyme
MVSIREKIRQFTAPIEPLSSGMYSFQTPPDADLQYRLHLRLEPDGNGILIINASTVLHLNQTAAEYAYFKIQDIPEDTMVREITSRYRVSKSQALEDYHGLIDRITTMITTPDLDPETFLDFERTTPYAESLTAPLRLDCAITYRLPDGVDPDLAPTHHVDRELTTEEWTMIIDNSWSIGIPHINFTGGEPTLRDDLPDLIELAEKNGQVTGLFTDGLRLHEEDYLNKLLQTGLDYVVILFHPENNLIWEVIEKVEVEDLYFVVHITITPDNVSTAMETINKLAQKGVENISLSIADLSLQDKLSELRDYSVELGLSQVWDVPVPYSAFNPVNLETEKDEGKPKAFMGMMYIEPDGDARPAQGEEPIVGNCLSDSWEVVWDKCKEIS